MSESFYIELKNLTVGFTSGKKITKVFSDLNAGFNTGSFIGIIGNNGLGKSTLIRTLCGLQKPLEGAVYCKQKNTADTVRAELAKLMAVVLTERVSGFNLTVYDFISSGRAPYTNAFHVLSSEDEALVDLVITKTGLVDFRNKKLDELSDGLYQKAAIAKALAQNTGALILDEPSAFLDFTSRHLLFEDLRNLAETENKCVMASSHDLDLVLNYCTHLFIMASDNRFEFIKASECLQHPLFNDITKGYFRKA